MRNKVQKQQLMTCLKIKNKKKRFNTLQKYCCYFLSTHGKSTWLCHSGTRGRQRATWNWFSPTFPGFWASTWAFRLVHQEFFLLSHPAIQLQQQLFNIYFLKLYIFLSPKSCLFEKFIYIFFHSFNIPKETDTQAGLLGATESSGTSDTVISV